MQIIVQGRMDKTLQGEEFSSFHPEMFQIAWMMAAERRIQYAMMKVLKIFKIFKYDGNDSTF